MKVFGLKSDGDGEWRRLHNEQRGNIVWVIKSRKLRWAGHVARMEKDRSAVNILRNKPTGLRYLGRPMRRWEDNIRMNLKEIGMNTRNWVYSAQDRNY